MLLFNKQKVSEIRKGGIRHNLITTYKMKEYFSEKWQKNHIYQGQKAGHAITFFLHTTHCLESEDEGSFLEDILIVSYHSDEKTGMWSANRTYPRHHVRPVQRVESQFPHSQTHGRLHPKEYSEILQINLIWIDIKLKCIYQRAALL